MKFQKYTGWFETENGVQHFEEITNGITDLYLVISVMQKHYDFGLTDMEVYDAQGNDVTEVAYRIIESIEISRKFNIESREDNDDA